MESFGLPKAEVKEKGFDDEWYERIKLARSFDYNLFEGNKDVRAENRREFLAGEVETPDLNYPLLESIDFDEQERYLLDLKKDVLEQEGNPTIRELYRVRINESIAKLRMVRETKNGNDRRFSRYNDFIYGKPDLENAQYIGDLVYQQAESKLQSDDPQVVEAAKRLCDRFFSLCEQYRSISEVPASREVLGGGESIYSDEIMPVEDIVPAFEEALENIQAEGWSVVVDNERGFTNMRVSHKRKEVNLPSEEVLKKRELTERKVRGLIEHEINTHIARNLNGQRSKLKLLSSGLDRYDLGEEGVALYNEQQVTGEKSIGGIPAYLAVCIAKGVDDGTPADFREVFEVMRDYFLVHQTLEKSNIEKAENDAYNRTLRIFRGTTGSTPGAVYTKDMAYFSNKKIWHLVSQDASVVQTFSIGKFDPTNDRHLAYLSELGILDQDLENLEKDSE